MNKTFTAKVRMTEESWGRYKQACESSNANPSAVLRALCMSVVDYTKKNSRLPDEFMLAPYAATGTPRDVPQNWIARALSKTNTLEEFKDIFASIIVSGLPLDWGSAVGGNLDYTREFDKAVDKRLTLIRANHNSTNHGHNRTRRTHTGK